MNSIGYKKEKGVGLIEVLVTLLILSTSLLALASLQTRSLQFNQSAFMRSQANIFAYDILERMRINNPNPTANINPNLATYNIALASYNLNSTAVTAPLAAADLDQWRRAIATALPDGQGGIQCDPANGVCTITIVWNELNSSGVLGEDKSTFVYGARL
jgi:type IV pilus assembly protein PilV